MDFVTVGGVEHLQLEVAEFHGLAGQGVAPAYKGRIYYDASTNKLRLSENTGAYRDIGGLSGPASAVNNELAVFDGATGKKIKGGAEVYAENGQLRLRDPNTYLSRDASNNMTFTDVVTGTRTLKNIGCPTYLFIKALAQGEGDIHLSQAEWGVSKALISVISVVTVSTDWDLFILQNGNGFASDDANIPKMLIMETGSGDANILLILPYEDEDAGNAVHLYYRDNSGVDTADIYIKGTELI